jgi:Sulfotransferase domain
VLLEVTPQAPRPHVAHVDSELRVAESGIRLRSGCADEERFLLKCLLPIADSHDTGSFDTSNSSKVIHLVRDPFASLYSKMGSQKDVTHSDDRFRKFCSQLHDSRSLSETAVSVPCWSWFSNYLEWHNAAFQAASFLELETYVLRYEWLESRLSDVLEGLQDFLEFRGRVVPDLSVPDATRAHILDVFSHGERYALRKLYEMTASAKTKSYVGRYFTELQ